MSEFPFSIKLPEEVSESLMINFGDRSASQIFFLKAQCMPRNIEAYEGMIEGEHSILRTDSPLLCYNPDDEGELMEESKNQQLEGRPDLTREF